MNERTLGATLSLMLLWTACASERADLGPRNELSGDVGPGGFGGQPILSSGNGGSGGTLVVSSAAAGGAGGAGGGCIDAGLEPNEDESTAPLIATISDCDSNAVVVEGILAGSADVDWYRYDGDDVFGCSVDPARELSVDGPVQLCKFAECNQAPNNTQVTCENDATPSVSSQGRSGCCHNTNFGMGVECDGADDDASIYLQITQTEDACISYSLQFHY